MPGEILGTYKTAWGAVDYSSKPTEYDSVGCDGLYIHAYKDSLGPLESLVVHDEVDVRRIQMVASEVLVASPQIPIVLLEAI